MKGLIATITIYPEFYPDFLCKASDCVHSCCAQEWDIDIDEDTAHKYLSMKGELGDKVRTSMTYKDNSYCFSMNSKGQCPLFTNEGLCQLIVEKDDFYLSDICAMHPRFFLYVKDFELSGVGLSCEKSVERLFAEKNELTFITDYPGERASLATLLRAIEYPLPSQKLSYQPIIEEAYYKKLLASYKKTEPINEAWTTHLLTLESKLSQAVKQVSAYVPTHESSLYTRIFQYILYRGLEKVELYGIDAIAMYAQQSMDFILLESAFGNTLDDNVRLWSEQIEYDTDNVDILLTKIFR